MKSWTPYVVVWSLFALGVLALAAYRKMLSANEDDSLHVSEGSKAMVSEQVAMAQRLEVVDKWGKLLTIIVGAVGLIMVAIYIYGVFQNGTTTVSVQ